MGIMDKSRGYAAFGLTGAAALLLYPPKGHPAFTSLRAHLRCTIFALLRFVGIIRVGRGSGLGEAIPRIVNEGIGSAFERSGRHVPVGIEDRIEVEDDDPTLFATNRPPPATPVPIPPTRRW